MMQKTPHSGKIERLLPGGARERDPMPDTPADKARQFSEMQSEPVSERLATPQELAEFGGAPPDLEAEARILALLEQQMAEPSKEDVSVALQLFQSDVETPAVKDSTTLNFAEVATPLAEPQAVLEPVHVEGLDDALNLYEAPALPSGAGEL